MFFVFARVRIPQHFSAFRSRGTSSPGNFPTVEEMYRTRPPRFRGLGGHGLAVRALFGPASRKVLPPEPVFTQQPEGSRRAPSFSGTGFYPKLRGLVAPTSDGWFGEG